MSFVKKYWIELLILVVSIAGVIGFLSPWSELFLGLTPIYLVLLALVVLFSFKVDLMRVCTFFSIAGLGFVVEVIGVKTGFPFGVYSYGEGLGPKLFGVPLVIGANWGLLVLSITSVIRKLEIGLISKSAIGASVMVLFDFFIEPVAIKYGWWIWEAGNVPFSNYLAWWVISFILVGMELSIQVQARRRSISPGVLISLAVFFEVLNGVTWSGSTWQNILLVFGTFCFMEFVAWFVHKYLMHGALWFLHHDHHVPGKGFFERNDAFFLIFAIPSWLGLQFGSMSGFNWWFYVGMGILFYGLAYFLVHEVFIHQRFKWFRNSDNWYLRGIRRAHKIHHKNTQKEGGESFGMLVVPFKYLVSR